MERIAFCLKLKKGAGEAYDKAHREVWPEMLALLKRAGVSEYSIFRREELLVLSMRTEDFNKTWDAVEKDPVNARWQEAMASYFEPMDPLAPGERFPMMREVFYLE
ncbi:MAG: L-rhamnose mutarotase [Acidobacteriaceae bacterium]